MNILHHIQSSTGATRSEVIVVLVLAGAILLGNLLQRCDSGLHAPGDAHVSQLEILQRLDSLLAPVDSNGEPAEPQATSAAPEHNARPHSPPNANASRGMASLGRVNLNTASLTQLQRLPGVGQATAERIVEHRKQTPFRRPEDVMLIRGIGEKKYAKMQPFLAAP